MRRDQQGRGPVSEGVTQGRGLAGEGPRDHRSCAPWWGGPGGLCTRLSCDVEVWLRKTSGCQVLDALGGCVLWGMAPGPKPGVSWYMGHCGGRSSPSSTSQCPLQLPHAALGPDTLTLGLALMGTQAPCLGTPDVLWGTKVGGSPWVGRQSMCLAGGWQSGSSRLLGAGLTGVPRAAGLGPWSAGHWSTVGRPGQPLGWVLGGQALLLAEHRGSGTMGKLGFQWLRCLVVFLPPGPARVSVEPGWTDRRPAVRVSGASPSPSAPQACAPCSPYPSRWASLGFCVKSLRASLMEARVPLCPAVSRAGRGPPERRAEPAL